MLLIQLCAIFLAYSRFVNANDSARPLTLLQKLTIHSPRTSGAEKSKEREHVKHSRLDDHGSLKVNLKSLQDDERDKMFDSFQVEEPKTLEATSLAVPGSPRLFNTMSALSLFSPFNPWNPFSRLLVPVNPTNNGILFYIYSSLHAI